MTLIVSRSVSLSTYTNKIEINVFTEKGVNEMNIFILHWNPRKCARWHVDKHVVKMILETCQLLYTAHWISAHPELEEHRSAIKLSRAQKALSIPESISSAPVCETTREPGYRPCHVRHPCAVWARASTGNYKWLTKLGIELALEYRFRYERKHSCEKHLIWLHNHIPSNLPDHPRLDFTIAMADEYKICKDPIRAYRHYYRTQKAEKGILQYTGRHPPHWLQQSTVKPRERKAHTSLESEE